MNILHKPTATAGQIVKDLELIVAKSPNIFLEYLNDDGNDMFVKGIKLRKDIAILETTGIEKRAATIKDMLAMFRMLKPEVEVVLQDGWEWLNFKSYDDTIIKYDEEDDYCIFTLGDDVRLVTTQQIEAEVKKIDEEGVLDYQVVPVLPHSSGLRAYRANCLRRRYGKLCLCYAKDEEKDSITVGELLDGFPVCAEFMIEINGDYYTVETNSCKNGSFCSIAKLSEKRLFTFYVGDMVYDPMKEKEDY